jgi:hypothetical protein|nr:MAG TPA: Protein of unknown function (DUF2730) [Caudoviricetes sp.]
MPVHTEAELMHWLLTVVLPVIVTGATFYTSAKGRASQLESRLTTLEVINREQEKVIESHGRRLDKHEEEQKITLALVERIDNLNENMRGLQKDVSDIKHLVDTNLKEK